MSVGKGNASIALWPSLGNAAGGRQEDSEGFGSRWQPRSKCRYGVALGFWQVARGAGADFGGFPVRGAEGAVSSDQ